MTVEDQTIPRVMLHAKTLGFLHPVLEKPMEFHAPLPADMVDVQTYLQHLTEKPPE